MERAIPVLPADDLQKAKDFYVNGLGFTVTWEFSGDGGKTGMFGVARGDIVLTIDCPMSGHGRNACASFEVEDADRYYEEWRSRMEIARPPMNEAWGARTFDVQDPAGNTLFVMGPLR